jgi:adenylate cyclase
VDRDASPSDEHGGSLRRLTFVQRQALKGLVKQARKRPDEPLSPADWESSWRFASQRGTRAFKRVLRAMPSSPRCGYCGAPFAGVGARVVGPLGYRPSRKNPNLCAVCVELAPPGGMTLEIGVLFADLRGFSA